MARLDLILLRLPFISHGAPSIKTPPQTTTHPAQEGFVSLYSNIVITCEVSLGRGPPTHAISSLVWYFMFAPSSHVRALSKLSDLFVNSNSYFHIGSHVDQTLFSMKVLVWDMVWHEACNFCMDTATIERKLITEMPNKDWYRAIPLYRRMGAQQAEHAHYPTKVAVMVSVLPHSESGSNKNDV